jgi:hypothetical protein
LNSDLKNILEEIINTGKIDQNKYNKLNDDDKRIIDILFQSHIAYKIHSQEEIDELINRYNIIKGEILIGNNNIDLLKELKIIVLKLVDYNVLSINQISQLLINLFYLL